MIPRNCPVFCAVCLFLLALAAAIAEKPPAPINPVYDPTNDGDGVVAADATRVVWVRHELIEATRQHRMQSFVIGYFIQKLDEAGGTLLYETRGRFGQPTGLVLPDGTAMLPDREGVVWAKQGQPPRKQGVKIDGKDVDVLAQWPDGIIIQLPRFGDIVKTRSPAFWVPVDGKRQRLDFDSQQPLSGEPGLHGRGATSFLRAGDRIAWLDADDNHRLPKAQQFARLFLFDVAAQKVTKTELPTEHFGWSSRLAGFDGTHAFTGRHLIYVDTAKVAPFPPTSCLGMRNGKIYTFTERRQPDQPVQVVEIPVDNPDKRQAVYTFTSAAASNKAARWPKQAYAPSILVLILPEGLWVWDQRWKKLDVP